MVASTVNSYTRLVPGLLGADQRHLGRREPHLRAARHPGRRQEPARRVPDRRRRHQSLPRARGRRSARACGASSTASSRTSRSPATPTTASSPPKRQLPRTLSEAAGRLGASQGRAGAVRRRRSSNTTPPAASGRSASSAAPSPTGSWRATSRSSDAHASAAISPGRRPRVRRAHRGHRRRRSRRALAARPSRAAGVARRPAGRARGDHRALLPRVRAARHRHRHRAHLADGPPDPLRPERGARHARARPLHGRRRRRRARRRRSGAQGRLPALHPPRAARAWCSPWRRGTIPT